MASRTLRSRTVESSQRDDVATSQEGECDWPRDQPEELDREPQLDETTQLSPAEASKTMDSEAQATETSKTTTGNVYSKESNASDMSKLEFMITSLFAKLDENLQDKLDTNSKDLKYLKDKLDTNSKDLKLDTNSKDLKNLQDKLDTNSKESKRDFKALEDKVETTNKTLNKLETSYRELKECNDKFQRKYKPNLKNYKKVWKQNSRRKLKI
jgi:chromosome segregation ATPase